MLSLSHLQLFVVPFYVFLGTSCPYGTHAILLACYVLLFDYYLMLTYYCDLFGCVVM